MTWGIKIAEFLVEMELFPQIRNQMGSNILIHSWLIYTCKEEYTSTHKPEIQFFRASDNKFFILDLTTVLELKAHI